MPQAPAKYDVIASRYDQRWRRYHAETLSTAASVVPTAQDVCLLDVPCGTGELMRWLLPRLPASSLVGVDASAAMLGIAREKWYAEPRVRFQQAHAEALPFVSGTFDGVLCCNSFHYFKQPDQVLGEFRRVLRPGGYLVIVDWCRDPWYCRLINWWKVRTDPSHAWMYTTEELRRLIEQNHFVVERADRFQITWIKRVRLWDMVLCVAVKPTEK